MTNELSYVRGYRRKNTFVLWKTSKNNLYSALSLMRFNGMSRRRIYVKRQALSYHLSKKSPAIGLQKSRWMIFGGMQVNLQTIPCLDFTLVNRYNWRRWEQ